MSVENAADERDQRLHEAVLEYLKAVDAGQTPRSQELMNRYPDLADDLREFLADDAHLNPLLEPWRAQAAGSRGGPVPEPASRESTVPPAIPGYEILGPLGAGGMGLV